MSLRVNLATSELCENCYPTDNKELLCDRGWLRIARVKDENLLNGETVPNSGSVLSDLKASKINADVFTFAEKVPNTTPRYDYHCEFDNAAVIPISTFEEWWDKRAQYDVRKAVKRSRKQGVEVKVAAFDDAFVKGIQAIYDESPVRQGTRFTHYKKDFEQVKRENSTYFDRSEYIGAYYEGELIGFIRMVYVDSIATTLQVISQKRHADKKPTNALIAKAIEVCSAKGLTHFVYGSFIYNGMHSSLTEFKRRNGFEEMLLPRYYIPLTLKGQLALKIGLHRGIISYVPKSTLIGLRSLRTAWVNRTLQTGTPRLS